MRSPAQEMDNGGSLKRLQELRTPFTASALWCLATNQTASK